MLQQTQVSRVLEKYQEFLREFPTIQALAEAPLARVLGVWQGMGYNRRALALKRMAEKIVAEHKGRIPRDRNKLEELPGVGPYTAGAVRAFAFNEPEIFIETNIRRIYIHHFFPNKMIVSDMEIFPIVEQTLDTNNPREWYWALMDYGSQLPKVIKKNPNVQSKHHTNQSVFKGSLRELRGNIIRTLSNNAVDLVALKHTCDNDKRIKEALEALIKDGLIVYENKKYYIA